MWKQPYAVIVWMNGLPCCYCPFFVSYRPLTLSCVPRTKCDNVIIMIYHNKWNEFFRWTGRTLCKRYMVGMLSYDGYFAARPKSNSVHVEANHAKPPNYIKNKHIIFFRYTLHFFFCLCERVRKNGSFLSGCFAARLCMHNTKLLFSFSVCSFRFIFIYIIIFVLLFVHFNSRTKCIPHLIAGFKNNGPS